MNNFEQGATMKALMLIAVLFSTSVSADQVRIQFKLDSNMVDGNQPYSELVLYADVESIDDAFFPVWGSIDYLNATYRYPTPLQGVCRQNPPGYILCTLSSDLYGIRVNMRPGKLSEISATRWPSGFQPGRYMRTISSKVVQNSERLPDPRDVTAQ